MPVVLIENFRAAFYSPFYAAIALGSYAAEGMDVELKLSPAADRTLRAVLGGEGHVSWGGPMRLMRALDEEPDCGAVAFCEVVGRDPFYLVGREPNASFRMNDLLRCRLGTVSEVPTPWYCLQHDLRLAGIDPATITRTVDRTMTENSESLQAGDLDVIQVFEPFAHVAVEAGWGHVWYAAATRGPTSYTTLNTTRRFLNANPGLAMRMTRAIQRTLQWIAAHDGHDLAKAVAHYLPDIRPEVLAASCADYKARGVWNATPVPQRAGIEWLRDAMLSASAIRKRFSYEDLVDARFAESVARQ